jgi:phosphatidylserine/phosphatidylglycerophosphate/cardiolipin synthase-like enzyme
MKQLFARRKLLMLNILGVFLLYAAAAILMPSENELELASVRPSRAQDFVKLERVYLRDFKPHTFLISNHRSTSQILITNEISRQNLVVSIRCDKKIRGSFPSIIRSTDLQHDLNLRPLVEEIDLPLASGKSISFALSADVKNCTIHYQHPLVADLNAQIELKRDTDAFPWLVDFLNYQDTGDQKIEAFDFLETPESGILAKAEILLGQKLDPQFIRNQNPFAPLDFSKAPHLRAIFLSTLVYRADFYGNLMARLLKYHAEHGTLVHVITTEYMMLDKDRELLHGLASQQQNFRLDEFRYYDPDNPLTKPLRYIDSKYRDMHIKLFVTLSDEESQNCVIFGGRNIHDGFVFKTVPDYRKMPELVQYGTKKLPYGNEDDFVHWNDLEAKLISKPLAEAVFAQLVRFWNRDSYTQTVEDFYKSPKNMGFGAGDIKSVISVPYEDGYALENLYISLIDGAQKSIKLSSPYLRPTKKILQAIERAAQRKVDITIQTRVELEGDTQAWLYEEVNKESINLLYNKAKIYKWTEDSILHSKFIIIDNKIVFMGSVNLSRRSFIQDIENGFIIRNESFARELNRIIGSYVEKSQKITAPITRKVHSTIVIDLLENQF